jgi:hypothetical protein
MGLPELKAHQYEVEFLTEHYVFAGVLEPRGLLMVYLNDVDRRTLPLRDVTATSLDTGSSVGSFKAGELFVRRDEISAIRLFARPSAQTVPLMPMADTLRLFTPRFAVQAVFHRGPETRLSDLFDGSGLWAPATDAKVYALFPTKHAVAVEAPMLIVNKTHIRFYQVVTE